MWDEISKEPELDRNKGQWMASFLKEEKIIKS